MLQAEGISRTLGSGPGRFTLHLRHLHLTPGTTLAVTGPSGCGKSTLLGLLALALRPDPAPGTLRLANTDALALWQSGAADALATLRARHVGFVPQTGALLPFLSLHDNIALPQALLSRPDPARIAALSDRLGLTPILGRRPAQVSVGQRQRAAIARALAHRPGLVLADEPTAAVHPAQAEDVLALLTTLAREEGAALLLTTHDPARAEAAGFTLCPCQTGPDTTTVAWPP